MSCDCNTIVIGEAGPQGPQGFSGIDGSNGTNGVNAFTTLTTSFTQPNEYPTSGYSTTIYIASSAWIALGQNIYISQAGYYQVTSIIDETSIIVSLLKADLVSPGSTVSSGRQVSPSSAAGYIDPTTTSLIINSAYSSVNPSLLVNGSNSLPLIQVDSVLNKVGINVSPVSGGKTLTVGGSLEVTGDTLVSSGYLKGTRLRVGTATPAAELTKLLFFNPTVTVTLAGTIGSLARVSATCTGAALGDVVTVGYASDPAFSFETDVSISAVVSSANTVRVFFQNHTVNTYTSASITLNIIVSTYTLVV
jgi:hypothetical protein